jgi:hypothetical protein
VAECSFFSLSCDLFLGTGMKVRTRLSAFLAQSGQLWKKQTGGQVSWGAVMEVLQQNYPALRLLHFHVCSDHLPGQSLLTSETFIYSPCRTLMTRFVRPSTITSLHIRHHSTRKMLQHCQHLLHLTAPAACSLRSSPLTFSASNETR